ncbi:MAG: glycosyltransferase family 4 protein [Bacteroidetes bacterium]|jgi:glycosyltransferase involved in cell wall biosynthesis|nr:glycosyltransferase family 4 protein [Bacteroidota bacterium]
MNILFLTVADINDINERMIYTDLLREFIARGHQVTIISPTERRNQTFTHLIEKNNSKILKVRTGNIQKTNMIERGLTTLVIQHQFLFAVKSFLNDESFDLLLYSTPPVTFNHVLKYLKKRNKAAITYLMLKDIFPQNAVDIDVFSKNSLFNRYFRQKEKTLYSVSDIIGCMSEANRQYLIKHNPQIPPEIITLCPNSIAPSELASSALTDTDKIKKQYSLPLEKLLFIYGGNFGKPQDIAFIVSVLQDNLNNKKVHFIMCGSGTELYKLERYLTDSQPDNVTLIKGLPQKAYNELLSTCDVGLIFLDHRYTIPNFPSRMLSYMDNCMPVFAATDPCTDIGEVILKGDFGWWCESNDLSEYSRILESITHSPSVIQEKGKKAKTYLTENYSSSTTCETILEQINKLDRGISDFPKLV